MKTDRLVPLTILSTCMYSFSVYMQSGSWIFPFPLYDWILLIVLLILYFGNGDLRTNRMSYWLIAGTALYALNARFFLEIVCPEQYLESWLENIARDIIEIAALICTAIWMVSINWIERSKQPLFSVQFISLLGLLICWAINLPYFAFAFATILGACLIISAKLRPYSIQSFWMLWIFLFLSKYITLFWLAR